MSVHAGSVTTRSPIGTSTRKKRVTSELREACLREVASIKEARRGDFPQEARPVAV